MMTDQGVNAHAHCRGVCPRPPRAMKIHRAGASRPVVAWSSPTRRLAHNPPMHGIQHSTPNDRRPPEIVPCSSKRRHHAHLQPITTLGTLSGMPGSPTGPQRADLPPGHWSGPTGGLYHSPRGKDETTGSAPIIGKKVFTTLAVCGPSRGCRADGSWRELGLWAKRCCRSCRRLAGVYTAGSDSSDLGWTPPVHWLRGA